MGISASAKLTALYLRAGSSKLTTALLEEPIYSPSWPVSAANGRKIIKRHFDFNGYKYEMAGQINWSPERVGDDWYRTFLSFSWLQDVASIKNDKISSSFAREFINSFTLLGKHDKVHSCAWEHEVVGERLTHWLYYRHFVLNGGSEAFFTRYQRSLIHHVKFLYNAAILEPEALGPSTIKALIAAACVIPSLDFILHETLGWLDELMARDVHEDGGHLSHSPNHHFAFLKTLIEIRELLESVHIAYDPLNDTIARMGAMLQMFTHGDGRLALFNHNLMEDAAVIAHVITLSGGPFEPVNYAQDSGYLCFKAQQTCAFMRMIPTRNSSPPLGVASIEFSEGTERILVNCGTYIGGSTQWRDAMQQASAFSTIVNPLDTQGVPNGYISQSTDEKPSRSTATLQYMLDEHLRHERHIELAYDGTSLKGRDTVALTNPSEHKGNSLILMGRFHLHPDIRCQQQKDGSYTLKSVSGVQWAFSCNLPKEVSIEESVYLGYYGKPQKTLQLAIRIPIHSQNNALHWELKKIA